MKNCWGVIYNCKKTFFFQKKILSRLFTERSYMIITYILYSSLFIPNHLIYLSADVGSLAKRLLYIWVVFFICKLVFHGDSGWSLAFPVSYVSSAQCLMIFNYAIQELLENFLFVTLGSSLVLQVLQITRVMCADVKWL